MGPAKIGASKHTSDLAAGGSMGDLKAIPRMKLLPITTGLCQPFKARSSTTSHLKMKVHFWPITVPYSAKLLCFYRQSQSKINNLGMWHRLDDWAVA